MKVTVTYNDKSVQVNLTDAQLETLGLKEKKKPTGYERVEHNHRYYCLDSTRRGAYRDLDINSIDDNRYEEANYYSDEKIAEANIRADRLMRKLRRFAAENGGIPSVEDWKSHGKSKWYIHYEHFDSYGELLLDPAVNMQRFGCVYFSTHEGALKALEEFRDELTWYFTEYQAMLY